MEEIKKENGMKYMEKQGLLGKPNAPSIYSFKKEDLNSISLWSRIEKTQN